MNAAQTRHANRQSPFPATRSRSNLLVSWLFGAPTNNWANSSSDRIPKTWRKSDPVASRISWFPAAEVVVVVVVALLLLRLPVLLLQLARLPERMSSRLRLHILCPSISCWIMRRNLYSYSYLFHIHKRLSTLDLGRQTACLVAHPSWQEPFLLSWTLLNSNSLLLLVRHFASSFFSISPLPSPLFITVWEFAL